MIHGRVLSSRGIVRVPIHISVQRAGLPQFIIQGYPGSVRRFRQSILSALSHTSWRMPRGRVVVDVGIPAEEKVWGESGLGLAVVLGLLHWQNSAKFSECDAVGEVCVDGSLLFPDECAALVVGGQSEALITGPVSPRLSVLAGRPDWRQVVSVADLVQLSWRVSLDVPEEIQPVARMAPSSTLDPMHLLALSLVWAGGHSLLLFGSPGEGKTLSRQWFEALAPDLSQEQDLARLRVSGELLAAPRAEVFVPAPTDLLRQWLDPRTGWLRKATHGAIWLDELPLVFAAVRTRLRGWIEGTDEETQSLHQHGWQSSFVATMNPCPCGYWGESRCVCSRASVSGVFKKISWPLLDRFALQWRVDQPSLNSESQSAKQVMLEDLRAKISKARSRQLERFEKLNASASLFELPHDFTGLYPVWRQRVMTWSPRRQVQFLQVVQTLLDGEWSQTPEEACQQAWTLCRGTESLREK